MTTFAQALLADGGKLPEHDLFGRFVGAWRVRNRFRAGPDAPWSGELERTWIFARIVGGLGIQDVIVGSDRDAAAVPAGSTVRAYDAGLGAWRVEWFGMVHGNFCSLVARPHGPDGIRQDGVEHTAMGEVPIRWNFSAITPRSFTWDGWSSPDGGRSWWLEQHMEAERMEAERLEAERGGAAE